MPTPAPYDLDPALSLLLVGAALALLPLAWVLWRHRHASGPRKLHALTLLTLFLTFDLVLFGAFTRLTDSGLGCPDWPGCYGQTSPLQAHADISAAQAAQPTGPVTHSKAWIEMIHRYLAMAVGGLIMTLALASSWLHWRRKQALPLHPGWPLLTLFWVCVQGAFGALTVTMKLLPAIVTLHLLGAQVLLILLCWQAVRYAQALQGQSRPPPGGPTALAPVARAWLAGALALVMLQIASGGWVSSNYAVLVCNTFPTCQGQWWPAMDWRTGFELWRQLGQTRAGEMLSLQALTAIHMAHRLMAVLVLAVLAALAWRLWHAPSMRTTAHALAALALWQLLTGLSNVVLGWPIAAALAHSAGAAAIVLVLTRALCTAVAHPTPINAAAPAPASIARA